MKSKVSIKVKIRDIERLEEITEKCFAVAKAHPYAKDIALCTETVAVPRSEKR